MAQDRMMGIAALCPFYPLQSCRGRGRGTYAKRRRDE